MIVRIARVKVGNRQAPSARQSAHLSAYSDLRNVHKTPGSRQADRGFLLWAPDRGRHPLLNESVDWLGTGAGLDFARHCHHNHPFSAEGCPSG